MIDYQKKLEEKLSSSNSSKWEERFIHSLGVCKVANELNEKLDLGIDKNKLYIASILHDYAKFDGYDICEKMIKEYNLDENLINLDHKLLHSFFGPYIINYELGIDDIEILKAIRYHTTGNSDMSLLEEVIFLSDYIEENRIGEEFENVRRIAFHEGNIKKAVAKELENLINHLNEIKKDINKDTLIAFEFYKKFLEKNMKIFGLDKLKSIYEVVEKVNAKDIYIYETKNNTPYFDYVIIATVSSERQLNAVASNIKEDGAKYGYEIRGVEGVNGGEWVLVDANDILINVFTRQAREHYDLDRIWKNLPKVEL